MHTIVVAGAGKSSSYLIQYLLTYAPRNKWKVIVADGDADAIRQKTGKNKYSEAAVTDITNNAEREALVKRADIVVSLMPPDKHILLARDCLKHRKNLITSSYISDEMKAMDAEVKAAGLMFMCEMGLDPGIDHMTANKIIHGVHRVAGVITSFKSYCGGLIAPGSDTNPWHYKFTWNPRNVITAGVGGATYLEKGKHTDMPYEKMFEHNKKVQVNGYGQLAWYPNRDSLRYLDLYEVPDIKTFIRATLRHPSFCKGWQAIIALGLTAQDDAFEAGDGTYAAWIARKTGYNGSGTLMKHVAGKLGVEVTDKVMSMLAWLGLFEDRSLPRGHKPSADLLLEILQEKWAMAPEDKDLVAMQHEVEYIHKGNKIKLVSTLVIEGEDREHSAMAKTVGLPMGILARLVLGGKIKAPTGVLLPNMAAVYRPVLTELAHYGISFVETVE